MSEYEQGEFSKNPVISSMPLKFSSDINPEDLDSRNSPPIFAKLPSPPTASHSDDGFDRSPVRYRRQHSYPPNRPHLNDSDNRKRSELRENGVNKPSKVLAVFGLRSSTTAEDLKQFFSKYGHVEEAKIIEGFDYMAKERFSRGFGFVTMSSIEEAMEGITATGEDLLGCPIRVDYSKTEGPHASTPGYYNGHRRRAPSSDFHPRHRAPRSSHHFHRHHPYSSGRPHHTSPSSRSLRYREVDTYIPDYQRHRPSGPYDRDSHRGAHRSTHRHSHRQERMEDWH